MDITFDATFWALVGLLLFLLVLIFSGAPGFVARSLDARAEKIRNDLDEARKLREDAQALLATYQRKQRDAEAEAAEIVSRAKSEAERMAHEARAALDAQVERRTRMAEQKIAQAEVQAVKEVREVAAAIAIGASERVIVERADAKDADLVDKAIAGVASKLH